MSRALSVWYISRVIRQKRWSYDSYPAWHRVVSICDVIHDKDRFQTLSSDFHSTSCLRKAKPQTLDRSKMPHRILQKSSIEIVSVWKNITVQELAGALQKSLDDVFEAMLFVPETESYDRPDSPIDNISVIIGISKRLGKRCTLVSNPNLDTLVDEKDDKDVYRRPPAAPEILKKRPPVVTIMGHVDHGKTTLLDSLRHSHIVDREFGGITQHIGAFAVSLPNGEKVTFLDTPGHAAFSAMRARGANCTDIVILVVAADDGVKEQTLESLHHAKEAGVPIVVAINKMDKPNIDLERVRRELLSNGLAVEEVGGEVQAVPISALKGTNLVALIEAVLAQAEVLELKADPSGLVEGIVVESRTDQTRGKLATMIVQRGTLRKGSVLVAGRAWAKVRSMWTDTGKPMQIASPSTPVEVIGWRELPSAGDEVFEVETEKRAHAVINHRKQKVLDEKAAVDKEVIQKRMEEHTKEYREQLEAKRLSGRKRGQTIRSPTTASISHGWWDHEGPKLALVIKGDVDGSVEALLDVIGTYHSSSQCLLDVVHYGVGPVTQKDVEFAQAFQGIIYSFNVPVLPAVAQQAKVAGISIKKHNIIYRLIDDVKEEINARLPPKKVAEVLGSADVLQEFMISEGRKKVPVAGCRVTKGTLKKKSSFRILRDEEVIYDGELVSMRHLKNEVESIHKDTECGLRFPETTLRLLPGDVIESYELVDVAQTIDWDPGF